ncbi:MAG: hypothetical protein K6E67_10310 [Prevotella sp.]|nr:hypothetical protein [Prevotella sp.]
MIVDSMTHAEVYRELEKDEDEVARWWLGKRKMLTNIAKWTTWLPFKRWYEYESTRKNRYIVLCTIIGRKFNDDSLTGLFALRKMDKGYALYVYRFPWQYRASRHIMLPHVFDQYHNPERGNVQKTGIELIKHFVERNSFGKISKGDKFSGRSVRYKGRDNICKSVTDGVLLGEVVNNMFIVHTFITYEMAGELQREEFEKNRGMIPSSQQIIDKYHQESREEMQRLKEDIIAEAVRMKNNQLVTRSVRYGRHKDYQSAY